MELRSHISIYNTNMSVQKLFSPDEQKNPLIDIYPRNIVAQSTTTLDIKTNTLEAKTITATDIKTNTLVVNGDSVGDTITIDCKMTGSFANTGQTVSCIVTKNGREVTMFFPAFDGGNQTGAGQITMDISALPVSYLPETELFTILYPVIGFDEGISATMDQTFELEIGSPNTTLYFSSMDGSVGYNFSGSGDLFVYSSSWTWLTAS